MLVDGLDLFQAGKRPLLYTHVHIIYLALSLMHCAYVAKFGSFCASLIEVI